MQKRNKMAITHRQNPGTAIFLEPVLNSQQYISPITELNNKLLKFKKKKGIKIKQAIVNM